MNISNFIEELKRRNVFKVGAAYAIAGWLIIQICTSTFPYLNLPDWLITAVIVFVGIGLPISLIFAWAFELTPEGIKKSKEVDITESVTSRTGKKLNGVIIGVLSVSLFFVLIERIFFAKASILEDSEISISMQKASIAVLPFVNMSGDQDNEYFSDGLSEELLNGLAKLDKIQVAGRTSSFQFKGTNPDLRDVGNQLGVKHILEGSVRKSGNRVRITAQLIQADNGFHLWSETYDRELTAKDIFNIQEEITLKVVEELKIRLLPEEESELDNLPTNDIEAYNAYLEATQLEVDRRADEIEMAIDKYEEAVKLDPSFAMAYSRLAYAYALLFNYGDIPSEEAKFLIRRNADQALLIDENQGKAYQALTFYYIDFEQDFEKAEEMALKGIELLPNDPLSHNALSIVYQEMERDDEVFALTKKAYELDPLNPTVAGNYVLRLQEATKYEEALDLTDRILERNPNYTTAIGRKVLILRNGPYGKIDEAFKLVYDRYQKDSKDYFILNQLFSLSRDLEMWPMVNSFKDEMNALYPNNRSADWNFIETYLINNQYDEAEAIIDEYVAEYGEEFRENFIGPLNAIYYSRGEYQKWIDLVEKVQPELAEDIPVIHHTFDGRALQYAWLLEYNGDTERAELIRTIALESIRQELMEEKEKGREIDATFTERFIAFNTKDFDKWIELTEKLYFEYKSKGLNVGLNRNRILEDQIGDRPDYIELKTRIKDDIGSMRDNVIEYLKTEGEWKEEWEEEN